MSEQGLPIDEGWERVQEIMRAIAPELVEIQEQRSRGGYLGLEHLAYALNHATFEEARRRGLGERADLMNFVPGAAAPKATRPVETALYRAYDAQGVLLYVGITNSPRTRMRGHERTSEWWAEMQSVTFEWFPSREEAEREESRLIFQMRPPFNRDGNPDEKGGI